MKTELKLKEKERQKGQYAVAASGSSKPQPGADGGDDADVDEVQCVNNEKGPTVVVQTLTRGNRVRRSVLENQAEATAEIGHHVGEAPQSCWHRLTNIFKPESVRLWKHWDRQMRVYFMPVFALYCIVMLACSSSWDPNIPASSQIESCF